MLYTVVVFSFVPVKPFTRFPTVEFVVKRITDFFLKRRHTTSRWRSNVFHVAENRHKRSKVDRGRCAIDSVHKVKFNNSSPPSPAGAKVK